MNNIAEERTCFHYRLLWGSYNLKKSKSLLNRSRSQCRLFLQPKVSVGHHACMMGLIDSCTRCEKDTMEHILCTWPAQTRTRLRVLGWLSLRDLAEVCRCDMRKGFARESGGFDLNDLRA